jgi:hypothetical protein
LDHLRGKFSIAEDHKGFTIKSNQENIQAKMDVDEEGRDAKEVTAIILIQERLEAVMKTEQKK